MVVQQSFRSDTDVDRQPVAIVSVDPVGRMATATTRIKTTINVNCAYAAGDSIIVPAVGEQWYVERYEREWRLYGRIPFNDPTLNIEPKEGQVSVGSASGPLELNGTVLNAHGPIALTPFDTATLDARENTEPGTVAYDSTLKQPVFFDGVHWDELGEPSIAPGTTSQYWRGDKTWATLNKAAVGLSNVDNTSDLNKPISTATQAALDLAVGDISGIATALAGKVDKSTLSAKGDMYAASGAATVDRLAVGANGQVLTASSGDFLGVAWNTPTVDAGSVTGGPLLASLIPGLDASKIISGVLSGTLIPDLAASIITSGVLALTTIPNLPASILTSGTLLSSLIPGLDASKIITGVLNTAIIPGLSADKIISGVLDGSLIPNLPATIITSGQLGLAQIPNLPATIINSGTFLASLIPGLDASKIITGVLNTSIIPGLSADKIISGVLNGSLIPNLPATIITSGQLALAQIPNLPASIINSGTFLASLIPGLDASKIITGVLNTTIIPGLNADKIIAGVLNSSLIPSLSGTWGGTIASSLLSGVLGQGLIPSLTTGWGGSILSSFLSGTLGTGLIPGLDASKIISGVLSGSLIPNLPASIINSGTFVQSLIPSLTSGWGGSILSSFLSGTLGTGLIPGLDASKIISGVLSTGVIPTVTAGMTSGLAAIDTLVQAWGGSGGGFTLSQLGTYAANIPHTTVQGLLGGADVGSTIQKFLDAGVQAVHNDISLANQSIATWQAGLNNALFNFLGYSPSGTAPAGSVAAQSNANDETLANRAIQKNVYANIDKTIDATFDLDTVWTQTTLPTVSVTQGNSTAGYINIRDGGIKQAFTWYGYPTGGTFANIAAFYLNVYSVSALGVWTPVYSTPNIVSTVAAASSPTFNSYNLTALNYLNPSPGTEFVIEVQIEGTGTYNLIGKTISSQMSAHPTAIPSFPAATRGGSTAVPTVDAIGNGGAYVHNTAVNAPIPLTWSHTIATTANLIVAQVNFSSSGGATQSMTCGGQPMNQLTSYNYSTNQYLMWFYLFNPPKGAQTLSLSYTGGSNYVAACSTSVINAGSLGALVNAAATGTSVSQTVTGVSNQLVLNQMGNALASTATFSAYSPIQDANIVFNANQNQPTVMGHGNTSGAASVTFSSTISASAAWGSSSLPILGPPISGIITFDVIGTPYIKNTSTGTTVNGTGSHSAAAGAGVLVGVFVQMNPGASYASFTRSVTYGGTAMTSLGAVNCNAGTQGWVEYFYLLNAPSGVKTVATSITGGSGTFQEVIVQSISYTNVGSFGTPVFTSGLTTANTGAITSAVPGGLIVTAMAGVSTAAASTAFTGYGGVNRYSNVLNIATSAGLAVLMGDTTVATVGASTTLSASTNANAWVGTIGVPVFASPVVTTQANPGGIGVAGQKANYSLSLPWLGMSGTTAQTIFQPVLITFNQSGTSTQPNPAVTYPWANFFDFAICGGGGGGGEGSAVSTGQSGGPGSWTGVTGLTRAQMGTSSLTWQQGAGGSGGNPGAGQTGGPSNLTIPGYGTIGASGGGSGASGVGPQFGSGPGNEVLNDHYGVPHTYPGGAPGASAQANGSQPGGPGAGGNLTWQNFIFGGFGADGIGYCLAYQ